MPLSRRRLSQKKGSHPGKGLAKDQQTLDKLPMTSARRCPHTGVCSLTPQTGNPGDSGKRGGRRSHASPTELGSLLQIYTREAKIKP